MWFGLTALHAVGSGVWLFEIFSVFDHVVWLLAIFAVVDRVV